MQKDSGSERWGVILAGGDGARLRSLTRFISGDDRPKQFCPLVGGQTLLNQTRVRIAPSIPADRTLFVLTRAHERFYSKELPDVPAKQLVVQPENRGTLPAIFCALLRIVSRNPDAMVAFFPSDHHYTAEARFMAGVEAAFETVDRDPESVILFGAAALYPEVEYGWIEPEDRPGGVLPRVKRFWEKPSVAEARNLLSRRCLWNTFVMVGRAAAFLSMIEFAAPSFYDSVRGLPVGIDETIPPKALAELYARIQPRDFSRQVLATNTGALTVLSLGEVGWSDLGDPQRVVFTLSRHGPESSWVAPWHRSLGASA